MSKIGRHPSWMHGRNIIGAGAALSVAACSLVLDVGRTQCTTDADCAGRGIEQAVCVGGGCRAPAPADAAADANVDPIWGCLGKVKVPPAERSVPLTVPVSFFNPLRGQGRPNLPVVACEADDPDCARPLQATPTLTNADGTANMVVYSGFSGFYRVTKNDETPLLLPSYAWALPVPDKDAPRLPPRTWSIVDRDEIQLIASQAAQQTVDDNLGHMLFVATNCTGATTAGALIAIDRKTPTTLSFYTDNQGFPGQALTETSNSGAGGYINLPPGDVEVTVRTNTGLLVSKRKFFIRAGSMTLAVQTPE